MQIPGNKEQTPISQQHHSQKTGAFLTSVP